MNFSELQKSELQKSELQKSELHFTSISTLKITCHFIIWFFFIWTSTKTWLQETFIQLETRKHRIGKKAKLEALEPQKSLVWIQSQSGSGHWFSLHLFFVCSETQDRAETLRGSAQMAPEGEFRPGSVGQGGRHINKTNRSVVMQHM